MLSYVERNTPSAKYLVLGRAKSAFISELIRENLREKSNQSLCLFYTLRESKESLRRCAAARDNRYASRNTPSAKYRVLGKSKSAITSELIRDNLREKSNQINHFASSILCGSQKNRRAAARESLHFQNYTNISSINWV
tara:strand:+ start:845 stop:1261 length:417 start_codon:yes stop_codon:yes gene_type:complete